MKKVVYYHAGCPVCVEAERMLLELVDKSKYEIEVVHLGKDKNRIGEAEQYGVKSVPAIVVDGKPYHINYGASIEEVKKE